MTEWSLWHFALYILQLFFRDKFLSLILFWFGAFIVAPSTLHKCYNLLSCFLLFLFSSAMSLGGMPYMPLCSCTFLHEEYTGPFSSCYTFCSMATCTASSSYTLLFTLIIGHSHVLCPTPQHWKHFTFPSTPSISCLLILIPYLITLLANTLNLF